MMIQYDVCFDASEVSGPGSRFEKNLEALLHMLYLLYTLILTPNEASLHIT